MTSASRKYSILVALACLTTVSARQDALLNMIPQHARGGNWWKQQLAAAEASDVQTNSTALIFQQLIDHSGSSTDTFSQRYYVDYSYCADTTSCPIFMYIGGEGTLSATPGGYTATLAKEHGALIFALEHRWYGESLPGDIATSVNDGGDMVSLTVNNALSDLAAFMTAQEAALSPSGAKRTWLMVGGSYPGALSAWFRVKHPDLAVASWSSSGVVKAVENFTAFDEIETEAVGDACAAQLRNVTQQFETAWDAGGDTRQALLDLFHTPSDFTKGDMAWMLADSAAMGPQYGYKTTMCSYLNGSISNDNVGVSSKKDMKASGATAAAAASTTDDDDDLLTRFAAWTNDHYGTSFGSSCYYSTSCLSDPSRVDEWYGSKSWVWQCCHELEYWQVAYPGSLRSSILDFNYFEAQCKAAFGVGYPAADVAAFNADYGGLNPDATQVIATNGGDDPWRGCTLNATLSAAYPETTAWCSGCGHCGDLHEPDPVNDPPELTAQRQLIQQYIAGWVSP